MEGVGFRYGEGTVLEQVFDVVTRSITFWDDVIDGLIAAAQERGVSVNWLVNQLLKEALERLKPEIELTT